MGTIADKLAKLNETKADLKAALLEKGQTVGDVFSTYPDAVRAISSGGGRRACRFVIGTAAAGWTAEDCDYLCDGTADDVEINAAIQALPAGGGEILVLDGTYSMDQPVLLNRAAVTLRGCGAAAKFIQSYKENSPGNALIRISADNVGLRDLSVDCKHSTYFGFPGAVSVLSGTLARLEAVSVSDCVIGFSVSSGAEQTRLLNCDCAQGKNSSFSGQSVLISGCHLGIATLNGSGGKIVGSQFHEGDTYNAALTIAIGSKNTICGNYIYSSYATVDFGAGSSFNVFSGNVVSGDSPSDSGTENVLANNVVTAG